MNKPFLVFYDGPVGNAAIVYGRDREHVKRVLWEKLRGERVWLPDNWTIEPLASETAAPRAILLRGLVPW